MSTLQSLDELVKRESVQSADQARARRDLLELFETRNLLQPIVEPFLGLHVHDEFPSDRMTRKQPALGFEHRTNGEISTASRISPFFTSSILPLKRASQISITQQFFSRSKTASRIFRLVSSNSWLLASLSHRVNILSGWKYGQEVRIALWRGNR